MRLIILTGFHLSHLQNNSLKKKKTWASSVWLSCLVCSVAHSCLSLCILQTATRQASSIHRIFLARIMRSAISFSRTFLPHMQFLKNREMCSFYNIETLFKRASKHKNRGKFSSRFQSISQFYFPTTDQTKLQQKIIPPIHFRSRGSR